jgi:hypothetical protein
MDIDGVHCGTPPMPAGGVPETPQDGASPLRAGTTRARMRLSDVPALSRHHHCNDPDRIPGREALALETWPAGVTPKVHYVTG